VGTTDVRSKRVQKESSVEGDSMKRGTESKFAGEGKGGNENWFVVIWIKVNSTRPVIFQCVST